MKSVDSIDYAQMFANQLMEDFKKFQENKKKEETLSSLEKKVDELKNIIAKIKEDLNATNQRRSSPTICTTPDAKLPTIPKDSSSRSKL